MADSSSDDSNYGEWKPYREREGWKDVTPIPQDDGPHPVVKIAYSEKFKEVYDYFRAIIRKDERSDRALELTTDALALNPANYTVWHYRRMLLKDLNADLMEELSYITDIIEDHPKNYQVWHHRQMIVDWLNDGSRELQFTESVLRADAKNYHCWQYRQWVIKHFSYWDKELQFVSRLIQEDFRNNSAWNQRYFVIMHTTQFTDEVIDREIRYTEDIIRKAPNNESPWNYLRGVLLEKELKAYTSVLEFCQELYDKHIRSPYLLAFIVDIYENHLECGCDHPAATLEKALNICESLSLEYDTIRKEYWNYISRSLKEKYGKKGE